ncbi:MAG TPA: tyrosine--tRNA ligase [Candidatus Paceibacterota bacterium]|nr:tyrosine--tRNA ligase [Candidatus Paceibacterota bacterium]
MKNPVSEKEINDIVSRGMAEFIDPNKNFRTKLASSPESVVIKFGVDPTRPDIHLGHAVVLRKLRQLQNLGCKVVFLIGDYTALIGDPTGKSKVRPEIEQAEIEANMKTYLDQVGKILRTDAEVFSWIRNSDWFYSLEDMLAPAQSLEITDSHGASGKMSFPENSFFAKAIVYENTRMQKALRPSQGVVNITMRGLLWTLRHITHSRLIERDMFQKRLEQHEELYMHEMLYPILQGIDSFALHQIYGGCDLEIGGSDQTFNMLMGRDVMRINKQEPQAVMSLKLLVGTDGQEKMSKSLDNYISIADAPADMYGKVMSIPDNLLIDYFELCTYTPLDEIELLAKDLKDDKKNPRDIKMRLGREIVSIYHGEKAAEAAEEQFVQTFQKGGIPDDAPSVTVPVGSLLSEVVLEQGMAKSKSEYRRLLEEGAVSNAETGEKITDPNYALDRDQVIRIGKIRFLKIVI